jgi:hypothetical protein
MLKSLVSRTPRVYWAMDLNPDQLLAMGKLKEGSSTHRILEWINRSIILRSDLIVALDRFMDDRLRLGARRPRQVLVMPPWSHETVRPPLDHASNWFRDKHHLQGKFVVMYSGNHSPANPLDTLLQATLAFSDDDTIRFAFIGGGLGKKDVNAFIDQHRLSNAISLPYQPLADLRFSLGAADVHVVSLGPEMVGIIHPCKVYGAMAVGRPILFVGPRPSHVSDLLDQFRIGRHVSHGDVAGCIAAIRELRAEAEQSPARVEETGRRAQQALDENLSREALCRKMCDAVETVMA